MLSAHDKAFLDHEEAEDAAYVDEEYRFELEAVLRDLLRGVRHLPHRPARTRLE